MLPFLLTFILSEQKYYFKRYPSIESSTVSMKTFKNLDEATSFIISNVPRLQDAQSIINRMKFSLHYETDLIVFSSNPSQQFERLMRKRHVIAAIKKHSNGSISARFANIVAKSEVHAEMIITTTTIKRFLGIQVSKKVTTRHEEHLLTADELLNINNLMDQRLQSTVRYAISQAKSFVS